MPREKLLEPGESPDAYRLRQREWMLLSQQNAIIAAFCHAGRPVEEILLGVKVLRTLSGMPAEGVLAPATGSWPWTAARSELFRNCSGR